MLDAAPFTTSMARATGITPNELRGPRFRRLRQGVYVPSGTVVDHGVRIAAARLDLGDDAVLVGPSAAWVLGSRLASDDEPVHVSVADGRPRRDALVHRHVWRLEPTAVTRRNGSPVTTAARTAVDLARGVGTADADLDMRVVLVDSLLMSTGTALSQAHRAMTAAAGCHGLAGARAVLGLARLGAESPRETRLRLAVVRAGLPEPRLQHVVRRASGGFVARLDMAWPSCRVGLEYDGAHHRGHDQHGRDLARHNALRAEGWTVFAVGAAGFRRLGPLLAQLRDALDRS